MANKNWKQCIVHPHVPVLEAIKIIDTALMQIALVTDDDGRLLGTLTDGDVRRGMLRGVPFSAPVETIMNKNPVYANKNGDQRAEILEKMRVNLLRHLPIVDDDRKVVDLQLIDELIVKTPHRDNWVVIMAGGLGSRLSPLTDDCPKPLLPVGDKPLLETILAGFRESGFKKFFFSVNYKAQMIQEHFGDGSKWNCEIQYLHEKNRLGTAGSLSLLPERPDKSLIVMNGDLLTKVNFPQLLDFHESRAAQATMCVRECDFQVPYGVVKIQEDRIAEISEKPVQRFFVNAGIYVLSPPVLEAVPKGTYLDMPTLFDKLNRHQAKTLAFPVREYWLDVGQMEDFKRAKSEFTSIFE